MKRVLRVVFLALAVAGAAALWTGDRAVEWRLEQMHTAQLEALARERPWDPIVLYRLGLVRAREGDPSGAAALLTRAAAADPSSARAHRALGRVLATLGRLEEAEAALRRALAVEPRDRPALMALADLYRRVGAINEAIALLEEWLKREPEDPEALYRLAECYGDRAQPDRRLALLERAVRRAPGVVRYRVGLGDALFYYGRRGDAERHFRRALQAEPDNPEVLYRWGRALAEHGDDAALAEATRSLQRAASLRPQHANTWMALGQARLRQRDLEAARAALERATRLDGFEDRTLLLLGQSYLRLGQEEEGRRILETYRRTTDRSRAIFQLEHRLHNVPNDNAARQRLARLYEADGQSERAAYHRSLIGKAERQ